MAGRPTDYTPALLKKAKLYLARAKENDNFYPSVAELALELDIARDTIYVWCKEADKAEFSDIVERVLSLQERRLSENGLMGKFNPTITKLLLSKHGYRESQDITSAGKALPTPILGISKEDE